MTHEVFDYVVIGSGFGGSVSAMRLTEKGYSVCILERGKRFHDGDFPKTNWNVGRFLWLPQLRCFGIMQMTFMKDIFVLHGSGVGGGSLVYANVLMEPDDHLFAAEGWRDLQDWKQVLRPHYDTAKRMLGVTPNPRLWIADRQCEAVAAELGYPDSFRTANVAVFFNEDEPGKTIPDPYFGGDGPDRNGCIHCGGCMVGCRHNAKNSLTKNYLYFAEKWGAQVRPESEATDIRALPAGQADGARYEISYRRTTAWLPRPAMKVRAKNVVVSAHAMGTMKLLFRTRDVTGSLPNISEALGTQVRTNSEALMGITARHTDDDYSQGLAITSFFQAAEDTFVEPVRYSAGSSFMRNLAAPLLGGGGNFLSRLTRMVGYTLKNPMDLMSARFLPRWAERSTILLVMQTRDNMIRVKLGRSFLTRFLTGLVSEKVEDKPLLVENEIAHDITHRLADKMNGVPQAAIHETLFGVPSTAHFIGGCPMGRTAEDGVVNQYCEVHNYPGMYIVDGSIMPANPGVNPSLTITALAEYAMSHIPDKDGQTEATRFDPVNMAMD